MAREAKKKLANKHVSSLPESQETQARNPESVPADGRYHHYFVVQGLAEDWEAPEQDAMHAANRLATIQAALNLGLHPQGEARYDGAEEDERTTRPASKRSTKLKYSVEVLPAHAAHAPDTVTPFKVLAKTEGRTTEKDEQ
jgi:hypothetical protein